MRLLQMTLDLKLLRTAPNLAKFGERQHIAGVLDHNDENLKKWLKSPDKYKPGNSMTGTYGNFQMNKLMH